jgi:short-subunit dehydrogenase
MAGRTRTNTLGGFAIGATLAGAWLLMRRQTRMSFRNASVLITGGARGLGLVLARQLGAEGARVYLVSRSRDELVRAQTELGEAGIDVTTIECDIKDPEAVLRAVDRLIAETGRVDLVINNAGVIKVGPLEHAKVEDFVDSLQTHFWGPFHIVRAVLPSMRNQGAGRIVNIASIGGRVAVPHLLAYGVGKFALVGFSQGLRAELRKDGILVTTVVPGLMRTGSHVRVQIRGQHAREAQWFGLAVASPLTSMHVDRAARRIVEAARMGRAHVTLGWQARMVEIAQAVAPSLTTDLMASVASRLLPGPSDASDGDEARRLGDIDTGWIGRTMPNAAAARNNEMPLPG